MSQIYVVLVEYATFFDVLMVFYYHSPFNVVCCMKIKKSGNSGCCCRTGYSDCKWAFAEIAKQ